MLVVAVVVVVVVVVVVAVEQIAVYLTNFVSSTRFFSFIFNIIYYMAKLLASSYSSVIILGVQIPKKKKSYLYKKTLEPPISK